MESTTDIGMWMSWSCFQGAPATHSRSSNLCIHRATWDHHRETLFPTSHGSFQSSSLNHPKSTGDWFFSSVSLFKLPHHKLGAHHGPINCPSCRAGFSVVVIAKSRPWQTLLAVIEAMSHVQKNRKVTKQKCLMVCSFLSCWLIRRIDRFWGVREESHYYIYIYMYIG